MQKVKAHTIYKTSAGKKVPGVTTVLGVLNKLALVKWANNLGLQGIDSNKYRDKMADIGTLAHLMILNYFRGEESDYADYSKDDIDKAENCLISFYTWIGENKVEPELVEEQIVSENFRYGGTIDFYGKVNGKYTLLDFKTSKAVWPEHLHQVGAYWKLLEDKCLEIEQVRILRIGRDEDEGFEDHIVNNIGPHWVIFKHCLEIYKLQNQLKKGGE